MAMELHTTDGVAGFGIKCDGIARERSHEDLERAVAVGLHIFDRAAGLDTNVMVPPVSVYTMICTLQ